MLSKKQEKATEYGTFPSIEASCNYVPLLHAAHDEIVVDGNCVIAGPRSMEDEVYQNPCANESRIAKLSESDKKVNCVIPLYVGLRASSLRV